MLQLILEYDPQPPFRTGSPEAAGAELTQHVRARRAQMIDAARQVALEARRSLPF